MLKAVSFHTLGAASPHEHNQFFPDGVRKAGCAVVVGVCMCLALYVCSLRFL